jgi:hypothetical protein
LLALKTISKAGNSPHRGYHARQQKWFLLGGMPAGNTVRSEN